MSKRVKQPKLGSKEFIALQNKWYAKLKKSGFEDIEFYDPKTGVGHNSAYPKDNIHHTHRRYNKATENHFRLCRNYLSFFPDYEYPKHYKVLWELYTEGVSYRDIIKKLGKRYCKKHAIHLRSLFNIFKIMVKDCYGWNKISPDGMLNQAVEDIYLDEVLIRDVDVREMDEN